MDYHQNARTTLWSREMMARKVLEQGFTLKLAAASFNVSAKTAAKWVRRYREQGVAGLADRSSRPQRLRNPTPALQVERVEVLRREPWTGFGIARATGLSRPTVSRILRRLKLNRLRDLEPAPVVMRYEHAAPGDLLHMDIKRLVTDRTALAPRYRQPLRQGGWYRCRVRPYRHRRPQPARLRGHLSG